MKMVSKNGLDSAPPVAYTSPVEQQPIAMALIKRDGGGITVKLSFRAVFAFFIAKLLLLCLASVAFQFVAVHRMLHSESSSSGMAGTVGTSLLAETLRRPRDGGSGRGAAVAAGSADRPVIAYVVTLTGCGDSKRYTRADAMNLVGQGAAVLRHSVQLAHSVSNKYDFEMYALVHPAAKACSETMEKLGYTTLVRNTPFDRADIQKEFLREHIDGASCCGAKEYIKLYAYTLARHPVAVVLDLDSLVLKPLDDLFDALLAPPSSPYDWAASSIPIHREEGTATNNSSSPPRTVEAFYTRDYNMVNSGVLAGVQGGFLVVKPSERVFSEYIDIVLEGDFREGRGWGGKVRNMFHYAAASFVGAVTNARLS